LRVSDQWSNAPDQLEPGEGVLRVVRIEALGVTPEMLPPMPELTSPSAMIFPHPEQRLVELTPDGPQSFTYWRWTIRPSNDHSTIVEPIGFDYFDTVARVEREVSITAQRVAYGSVTPDANARTADLAQARNAAVHLPSWPLAAVSLAVFLGGMTFAFQGYRPDRAALRRRFRGLDPLVRALRQAAKRGDAKAMRRAATALMARDGTTSAQTEALARLDAQVFAPHGGKDRILPLSDLAGGFLSR